MEKKYKLNISVRHAMTDHHIGDVELDTTHWTEFERLKNLEVFKPDAYLVFSLEELPEPEEKE